MYLLFWSPSGSRQDFGRHEAAAVRDGEKQRTVIAMDGGLYERYTKFSSVYRLESTLKELLGDEGLNARHLMQGFMIKAVSSDGK
ncbi:hexokinase A [Asimina triloba]